MFGLVIGTIVCVAGAFMLTRKYEASTTILVRPDQTLNPLAGYEVMMASDEQLRNFNEIIYSRYVLQSAADSLGLISPGAGEAELQAIVGRVRGSVFMNRLGGDSFRMTFVDTDPVRAKRGAEVMANLFIQMKLSVQNRQNALTVQFYEQKVAEYKQDFETTVQTVVSNLKQRVQEMPVETRALYSQVEESERNIRLVDAQVRTLQEKIAVLNTLPDLLRSSPNDFRREDGKQPLFELERSELPYASELRTLVLQYDELTRRYKGEYPDVVRIEGQIVDLLRRMRIAAASELTRLNDQLSGFERRRASLIEELKKSSVSQQESQEKESSYDVKRRLYDDMKMKLEQARLAQEVGERGANQFVILDPPLVPLAPTKPNRMLIILAGFGLGLFLGILTGILVELLDTTVRVPSDIETFGKPIIAYLPDRGVQVSRRRRDSQ